MLKLFTILFFMLVHNAIVSQKTSGPDKIGGATYGNNTKARFMFKKPATPDEIWGKLFTEVQLKRALGDNKSFVDAVPLYSAAEILSKYNNIKKQHGEKLNLKNFVEENFRVPFSATIKTNQTPSTLKKHLEEMWPLLTRKADVPQPNSSLLPLPRAYVVPGGRFREIYYWDSYFTMLGLAVSNRFDLIENMLDNFSFLINRYGHIPNGNRSYYLSRSQPPYFALMVDLLQQKQGDAVYRKYLPAMQKEYAWWMEGQAGVKTGRPHRRVVKMDDVTVLNRYWDDKKAPREESYFEDVQNGMDYKGDDGLVYTHLRAGAESGWDFSSRWLSDTVHLSTIETTNIIPVDLNCLIYAYELILSKASQAQGQRAYSVSYLHKAENRKTAILKYCWNKKESYFFDYNFKTQSPTNKWSLAGVLPLFTQIASNEQALSVKNHIEEKFMKDGGVVTTIYHTGQQWDAPNGWAPLQYLAVKSLINYRQDEVAKRIAERWMRVNETVYANTGKMLEKYNVEDIQLESGGGEYPTQDGFGWSNGVYLKFYSMFKKEHN